MNTIEQFNNHVMGTYGRYDLVLDDGENRTATDEDGKKYIDFGSGIGTNSLGFCDDDWVDAICTQAKKIQHTSNYYYTKVQADFAEKLCTSTGYSKVFFGNSGAEANECAIKLARKYSFDKYGKGRSVIITLVNSFHGRTLATLSATGQDVFHNYFFPFVEDFINVKANDIDDLMAKLNEYDGKVCAVMFEFVQGEGGVIALEQDFVDTIFTECEKRDILTIGDEVQTGIGRTGKLLAHENYGIKPDVVTLAKGLGGGLPIGACLCSDKLKGVMNITDVGHLASDADTGEDKMLKGAKRENKSVMEIAQYYTDAFFADCDELNIKNVFIFSSFILLCKETINSNKSLLVLGIGKFLIASSILSSASNSGPPVINSSISRVLIDADA